VKNHTYATEAELCADFLRWVREPSDSYTRNSQVWIPYAETAGWDILLVGADGTQIGIEAKLRLNLKVLSQALPERWDHWHDKGPDFRAILVPHYDSGLERIVEGLGLVLFHGNGWDRHGKALSFSPALDPSAQHYGGWHWWSPKDRCPLPAYVPDVVAGASGPIQLTDWKVSALRICAILEIRGFVTRDDFRKHRIDPRRWTGVEGWLRPGEVRGQYIRGHGLNFEAQHPTVYAQVLTDVREAMAEAPTTDINDPQKGLL